MTNKPNPKIWSDLTMDLNPPAVVMALSMQVHLEPMEWKEYEDRVVIVFTNGQKMVFYREQLSPTMTQYVEAPGLTTPKTPAIVGAHGVRPSPKPTPKPTPAKKK
jgi:hypothetical protein